MHPEIRNYITERARGFFARQLIDRGPYVQSAESGFLSFDDVYFVGVCIGATSVAHDKIFQTRTIGNVKNKASPEFQLLYSQLKDEITLETSRLVAEIYNSSDNEMLKKYRDIEEKFQSWVQSAPGVQRV